MSGRGRTVTGSNRKWTDDDRRKLIAMFADKTPPYLMAHMLGCRTKQVQAQLQILGLTKPKPRVWGDERHAARCIELLAAGEHTQQGVADALNLEFGTAFTQVQVSEFKSQNIPEIADLRPVAAPLAEPVAPPPPKTEVRFRDLVIPIFRRKFTVLRDTSAEMVEITISLPKISCQRGWAA